MKREVLGVNLKVYWQPGELNQIVFLWVLLFISLREFIHRNRNSFIGHNPQSFVNGIKWKIETLMILNDNYSSLTRDGHSSNVLPEWDAFKKTLANRPLDMKGVNTSATHLWPVLVCVCLKPKADKLTWDLENPCIPSLCVSKDRWFHELAHHNLAEGIVVFWIRVGSVIWLKQIWGFYFLNPRCPPLAKSGPCFSKA